VHFRNLNPGYEDSVPAVEQILERGRLADWRALARKVEENPHGPAAQSLRVVLGYFDGYGTAVMWRRWLAQLDARQSRP
jgi:hypothetical protein